MDVATAIAMSACRAVMIATTESIATNVVRVPRPAAAPVRVRLIVRSAPLRAMGRSVRTAVRWRAVRTTVMRARVAVRAARRPAMAKAVRTFVMRARVSARTALRRVARAMTAVVVANVPPVDRSRRARVATPEHVRAARRVS